MDTRTGDIYDDVTKIPEDDRRWCKPMAYPPTERQRRTTRVGRNDPCPCGSTRKFKRCCMLRVSTAP